MRDCESCKNHTDKGCTKWKCEFEPTTKNDLEVDCISRTEVLKLIYDYKENHSENRKEYPINYGTLLDMIRWIRKLPSVTPQLSSELAKNSKKLEKNFDELDCISRKRAIERLKLNFPISQGADNSRDRHRYMQALADLQAIKELPSITPQEPRWIPVSERLPKWGEEVLTIDNDGNYEINHIIDDDINEWFYDGVVAWMPLPQPYEPQESEVEE